MTKSLLRSFAGGEITPEMFGRLDLSKFQTGLRKALNFQTLAHGPAARRPGTVFVNESKDSGRVVRLVPFTFSSSQSVMLEFGHNYVRFHTADGSVLEADKAIIGISANEVRIPAHGWGNGDWIFIGGRFCIVEDPSTDLFTTLALDRTRVYPTGATAARVYTVASPYAADKLAGLRVVQNADVMTITHPSMPAYELRRMGATNWAFAPISFLPTLAPPTGLGATATVADSTNPTPQRYKITAVAADGITESLASSIASCSNNLTLAGNYNTLSWATHPTAARYNAFKLKGGVYGYIGQTTATTLVDDNVTPDTLVSPPEDVIQLNSGANDYPTAVTYYEQRRWFAGTLAKPQNVWATRSSTESNLTSSIPSRADDALLFRLAAQQHNAILHLVPLADLIALTAGGEFRVFSEGSPAITPDSLSVKPQSYSGANSVQPAVTSASILYVQAQGSRVREITYEPSGQGYYRSIDVSLLAPHLFNGYTITQLAYTRAPEQVLWAVRSDGVLLGMTYVPDQQVYGWHQHATDGLVESVAVMPEGGEDVLYLVVKRIVNGRAVRYIERLHSRIFVEARDAFYVDCGLTYRGAPVDNMSGLWHLEGKTVSVLADAAVVPPMVVTGGAINLPNNASVVHVGLPYVSDLVTLPLAYDSAPAAGQGTMKNVNRVHLRVTQSSLVKAGPSFDKLREYPARAVSDPYGSPPALRTGELALSIDPSWNTDGSICIRQDAPLPLTILSLAPDTATGG